ncbi:hypothetical protein ACIRBX_38135 [Kitasatospora sp. NPDC096147]|uniref:hypothetical protein n=1 Tax=Kitasatospora sp. NPDC096147 TaxID=3364093 RepID=UPI00381A16EB
MLLRICGPDGLVRGLGFVADGAGTVVTARQVVAGVAELVLHSTGGQARVVGPEAVEELPGTGLALVHTAAVGGVPEQPPPIADGVGSGLLTVCQLAAGVWELTQLQGGVRVVGPDGVLELELPQLRGPVTAGAPVLCAESGAVLGVLAPGAGPQPVALPLAGPGLAGLRARNAEAAPAYGRALNLGGVLRLASVQLGSASAGPGRIADLVADRVERPDGLTGEEPRTVVSALLGPAGSGRSTELAALAARRAGGGRPLPTLWLRGADLRPEEPTPAAAVQRQLARAAALLEVPTPELPELLLVCAAADRPLLVVLDGLEEAPSAVTGEWLTGTAEWLSVAGARLLVAARPEGWPGLAGAAVHGLVGLPAGVAEQVARRYGTQPGDGEDSPRLRPGGEAHRAARAELWAGWLERRCRETARAVAGAARRSGAHRRGGPSAELTEAQERARAEVVAERVREAARRMLATGHGTLGAADFAELFPATGGWDRAALASSLLVPAGPGYRFPHEDLADWLQAAQLDLDAALRLLLGETPGAGGPAAAPGRAGPGGPAVAPGGAAPGGAAVAPAGAEPGAAEPSGAYRADDGSWPVVPVPDVLRGDAGRPGDGRWGAPDPSWGGERRADRQRSGPAPAGGVPRWRAGVLGWALRRVAERHGPEGLDAWLWRLWRGVETAAEPEEGWWARRLLVDGLGAGTGPAAHRELLERIAERGGGGLEPAFWTGLALPVEQRMGLLRRLVTAGQPVRSAVAELLAAEPDTVLPLLCGWYRGTGGSVAADLADDLLFVHRLRAVDDLTECLAIAAHPRADALLVRLAAEEPSALCRAVDRWSHRPGPQWHVAAAVHGLRAAPYATGTGAELLRHAARTLLAREDEPALHGAALALLVRSPEGRVRHLERALAAYLRDDPFVTAEALAPALADEPEPVLAAFRRRLAEPGAAVAEVLRVLAGHPAPELLGPALDLAAELLERTAGEPAGKPPADRPDRGAGPPERGTGRVGSEPVPGAAAVDEAVAGWPGSPLGPLRGTELLGSSPELTAGQVAEHLAGLLAGAAGSEAVVAAVAVRSPALRRLLALLLAGPEHPPAHLAELLAGERDPSVLVPLVDRLAARYEGEPPEGTRELVGIVAQSGGAGVDAALVRAAGRSAPFARLLADWPGGGPGSLGGPLLARMRLLTADGRDPQYAAAEAERCALLPAPRAAAVPVPTQHRAHGTL